VPPRVVAFAKAGEISRFQCTLKYGHFAGTPSTAEKVLI
jgi:hypothetical protein